MLYKNSKCAHGFWGRSFEFLVVREIVPSNVHIAAGI